MPRPVPAHIEGRFPAADGLALYWQAWHAPGVPTRGTLVNFHGLGDHSGLYPTVVDFFPPRGFPVYSFDMRGNGRSPGQRAYVRRWSDFRDDAARFLALVEAREPGRPIVAMGTSLGGLVLLELLAQDAPPLAAAVAVAPPLGELGVPRPLLLLARIASRVVPRFSLETGMDLSGLSRDPEVVRVVLADPLFHRKGTARLATEVEAAARRVHAHSDRIGVPVLLLHGGADRMVSPEGTRQLAARLGPARATLRIYDDANHVLLADLGYRDVLADILAWIDRHLSRRSPAARPDR